MDNVEQIIQIESIDNQIILVNADTSDPVTVIDNLKEIPVFSGVDGIPIEEKGMPNGVATLDSNGKIPTEQIPDLGIDIEQIEFDVKQWIADAVDGKIEITDLIDYIKQSDLEQYVKIESLEKYALKNDLSNRTTSEEVSTMIDLSIQPLNDNLQNINDNLGNIDLLLSEILGE